MLTYFVAWAGNVVLAMANGGLRDFVYKSQVGDLQAHQISTGILLLLLAGYLWFLVRNWPIKSKRQAWSIGVMWFLMTEVFEFGMGIMTGESWSKLLHAYNIFAGQIWILIPLWVLMGPYVFYRFVQKE